MDVVRSVNGVLIRLTDERWEHIVRRHRGMAVLREPVLRTIAAPRAVVEGNDGELLAIERAGGLWLVVAYREIEDSDGFVITAFQAKSDPARGRTVLWPST
jgi:hypothetical protein